jgi:hypothetical protein
MFGKNNIGSFAEREGEREREMRAEKELKET